MPEAQCPPPNASTVLVIGGGVAGLSAARSLGAQGVRVLLVEAAEVLGGMVLGSHAVFPRMTKGKELISSMSGTLSRGGAVEVMLASRVTFARVKGEGFEAEVETCSRSKGGCVMRRTVHAGCVIVATGLEPIDPSMIPELGYPKLRNVVVSSAFEGMLGKGGLIRPSDGGAVGTVAFVQCVGSRVEKRGVPYCSSVCCMNAIKNAIAVKDEDSSIEAYVLYIDIRMHGKGYEALYRRARERGVRFLRGQPSMVVRKQGSERVLVCGENTLLQELYEIPADLVVLGVGLRPRPENREILEMLGVGLDKDGLVDNPIREESVATSAPGVFVAGCVEAPKDARESIAQGEAAAMAALRYLSEKDSSAQ